MNFEDNPIFFLFLLFIGATWLFFPFVVMHRLKKIHQHMDRAEARALAADEEKQLAIATGEAIGVEAQAVAEPQDQNNWYATAQHINPEPEQPA